MRGGGGRLGETKVKRRERSVVGDPVCDLEGDNGGPHVVKGQSSFSPGNFSRRNSVTNLQKRPGGARQSYPGAHVSGSLARRRRIEIKFVFRQ
jgi:hypothetical protein